MQIVTHPHSICIVKTTCPCWERSPVNLAFKSCALKAGLWPGTGYSLDGLLTQQLQKQVGAAPKATGCTLSALTSLWKKAPLWGVIIVRLREPPHDVILTLKPFFPAAGQRQFFLAVVTLLADSCFTWRACVSSQARRWPRLNICLLRTAFMFPVPGIRGTCSFPPPLRFLGSAPQCGEE